MASAVVVALLLAACGDGDTTANGDGDGDGAVAAGPLSTSFSIGDTSVAAQDGSVRVVVEAALDRGAEYAVGPGTLRLPDDVAATHRFVQVDLRVEVVGSSDRALDSSGLVLHAGDEVAEIAVLCADAVGDCVSGGTFRVMQGTPLTVAVFWVVPDDVVAFDLDVTTTAWDDADAPDEVAVEPGAPAQAASPQVEEEPGNVDDAVQPDPDVVEPWVEDFGGGDLEPGWRWFDEVPERWDLTTRPGWLQITAVASADNVLVRDTPEEPFLVQTTLRFEPTSNFQFAGIIVARGLPDATFVQFGRQYCDASHGDPCRGDGIYLDLVEQGQQTDGESSAIGARTDVVELAVLVDDDRFTGWFRVDEDDPWTRVGVVRGSVDPGEVGVIAHQAREAEIVAQFNHVTITSPFDASAPAGPGGEAEAEPEGDWPVMRLSARDDPDDPILLEVLRGEVRLVSGTTLRAGSSVWVSEDEVAFRSGQEIQVGPGGVELEGRRWEEGTRLFVTSSGMREVSG